MIRFEHPEFLWLLILVPVFALAIWFRLRQRRKAAQAFVDAKLLDQIAYSLSRSRLNSKAVLWTIAFAFLLIGAANPQVGTKTEEIKREGIDIVIALDVSNGMLCEDIPPSRLESAKHELLQFVSGLEGDRVGLVAFAGSAINHSPLTMDYSSLKLLINVMNPSLIADQGTGLADAIEHAERAFTEEGASSRVIVIITDGEDHEGGAVEAAQNVAKEGIRVYVIGMGTVQGAPIPMYDAQGRSAGFRRDKNNQVIVTKLNETLLQQVAEAGNGRFLRGTRSGQELETIWEDISAMEKTELGQMQYTAFEDRYQYFVFPGFLLLLIEFLISERKGRPRWLIAVGHNAKEKRA